jgi:hypothetical protein
MRAQLRRSTIFNWLEAILARCADLMERPESKSGETERPLGGGASANGALGAGSSSALPADPWREARP